MNSTAIAISAMTKLAQVAPGTQSFFGSLRNGISDWLSDADTPVKNPVAVHEEPEPEFSWNNALRNIATDVINDINTPSIDNQQGLYNTVSDWLNGVDASAKAGRSWWANDPPPSNWFNTLKNNTMGIIADTIDPQQPSWNDVLRNTARDVITDINAPPRPSWRDILKNTARDVIADID